MACKDRLVALGCPDNCCPEHCPEEVIAALEKMPAEARASVNWALLFQFMTQDVPAFVAKLLAVLSGTSAAGK